LEINQSVDLLFPRKCPRFLLGKKCFGFSGNLARGGVLIKGIVSNRKMAFWMRLRSGRRANPPLI
jgi:hypothetical protein